MAIYPSVLKFYWYFSNMAISNMDMVLTVQDIGTCARKCTTIMTCHSFFFDTLDNKCMLHSGIVPDTDSRLIQQHGMRYYTNEKAKSCLNSPGFKYEGPGLCLKYVTSRQTWQSARAACQADGGFLIKVDSETKNSFLKSTYGNERFWIGGNDLSVEGTWVWLDGSQISGLDDWVNDEPDGQTNQNCMFMSSSGWYNGYCSVSFTFLCEM